MHAVGLLLFLRWSNSEVRRPKRGARHLERSVEDDTLREKEKSGANHHEVSALSLPLESITYLCILSSSSSKLSCQSNFCVQASPPIGFTQIPSTLLLWPPGVHYLFAHSIVLSPEALLPIKLCIQAPLYTQPPSLTPGVHYVLLRSASFSFSSPKLSCQSDFVSKHPYTHSPHPSPLECITYFCVPPLSRSLLRSSPASWKLRWHLALLSASLAVPTAPGVCGWTRSDEPGTTRRSVSYTSASR